MITPLVESFYGEIFQISPKSCQKPAEGVVMQTRDDDARAIDAQFAVVTGMHGGGGFAGAAGDRPRGDNNLEVLLAGVDQVDHATPGGRHQPSADSLRGWQE